MKKICLVLIIMFFFLADRTEAQQVTKKNLAGFGVTYLPHMSKGMYFDSPWDFWPNNEPSTLMRVFYARQLNETLRLGIYLEAGANKFTDQTNTDAHSFKRRALGLDWIAAYPKTKLHFEVGGYAAFSTIKANNWDDLKGGDYGMLAGPAFDSKYVGISAHFRAGFSPNLGGKVPEGVLLYTPGVLFRIYGKF